MRNRKHSVLADEQASRVNAAVAAKINTIRCALIQHPNPVWLVRLKPTISDGARAQLAAAEYDLSG